MSASAGLAGAQRWVVAAIVLAMAAIIGIFLWAVIRPPAAPDEAAAGAAASAEKRVVSPRGAWRFAAQAVPRADRSVAVGVSATDAEGRPIVLQSRPTAVMRMLDMAMPDERIDLSPEGPGSWRGTTRVSMAGRWSIRVQLEGESLLLTFRAVSL